MMQNKNEQIYDVTTNETRKRIFIGNGTQITVFTEKDDVIGIIKDNVAILSCICQNSKIENRECDIFYIKNFEQIISNHIAIENKILKFDNKLLNDLVNALYKSQNEKTRFEQLISINRFDKVIDCCQFISETDIVLHHFLYKTSTFCDNLGNYIAETIVFDKTSDCKCISTKYTITNQFFKADLY